MEQEKTNESWKTDQRRILHALLIGVFIGIAVYAAAKKGFGWAFLLPLAIAVLLLRSGRRSSAGKPPRP